MAGKTSGLIRTLTPVDMANPRAEDTSLIEAYMGLSFKSKLMDSISIDYQLKNASALRTFDFPPKFSPQI